MQASGRRLTPRFISRVSLFLMAVLILATSPLHAVVVHGKVTDPLGDVVAGAKVQLMQGDTVAGSSISGPDGTFEVRSTAEGRFVLVTGAATFTPAISQDFYGGAHVEQYPTSPEPRRRTGRPE